MTRQISPEQGVDSPIDLGDNLDIARFIEVVLHGGGFPDVSIAGDGEAGLERFRREDFDLVLTGFVMPRLMGDEVVRRIRTDP